MFVYILCCTNIRVFQTPVVVKLPDLKLHPNIFNMSPMSLINCTSPQAPHPSQVPMPTELCPPFGDKYKPITTINNNNHYNDNQFCCPMMGNNDLPNTNDQGNSIIIFGYIIVNKFTNTVFFFFWFQVIKISV